MAQRFIFFNSTPGDPRKYFAQDFADYFKATHLNGLLHPYDQPGLKVSVKSGMIVSVEPGMATLNGYYYENTTPHELTHQMADVTYNRIDRVVLRLDSTHNERNVLLHVKKGVPASSPQPPGLTRNADVYELSLARILVRANTAQLNQSDLTDDRRDDSVCGPAYLTLPIPPEQIQAVMDEWFASEDREMYVKRSEKGVSNGIATLGAAGKLTPSQGIDYIPKTEKGVPGGVATVGADGRVPNHLLGYYSPSDVVVQSFPDTNEQGALRDDWVSIASYTLPASGRFRTTGILFNANNTMQNAQIELRKENGDKVSATLGLGTVTYGARPFAMDSMVNMVEGSEVFLWLHHAGSFSTSVNITDFKLKGSI